MVFNLFNLSSIIPALSSHFHLNLSKVTHYFESFDFVHATAFDFVDAFHIDLLKKTIGCKIVCRHLTISSDKLHSIMENGLLTLDQVLMKDTPLNRFLSENGIVINVEKHEMLLHGSRLSISSLYDPCSPCVKNYPLDETKPRSCIACEYHDKMALLHSKLYQDKCEVEVYIRGSDTYMLENYNSITSGPEILFTIGSIIQKINPKIDPAFLQDAWSAKNNIKRYILEFLVPLCMMETNTDYKSPDDFYNWSEWFEYCEFASSDYYEGRVPKEFFLNKKLLEESVEALRYVYDPIFVGTAPIDNGFWQILPKYHISPESLNVHFSSDIN